MKIWRTVYKWDERTQKVILGDEYSDTAMKKTILACTEDLGHAEYLTKDGYWQIVEIWV